MKYVVVVALLFGCGGADKDWSGKPLEPAEVTVDGVKYATRSAVQVTEGELPKFDATKAMLEKICDSITPK